MSQQLSALCPYVSAQSLRGQSPDMNQKNLARSTFEGILTLSLYWILLHTWSELRRTNDLLATWCRRDAIFFSTTADAAFELRTSKNRAKFKEGGGRSEQTPAITYSVVEDTVAANASVPVQRIDQTIACFAVINDEDFCSLHAPSRSVRPHLCVCAIALTNTLLSTVP